MSEKEISKWITQEDFNEIANRVEEYRISYLPYYWQIKIKDKGKCPYCNRGFIRYPDKYECVKCGRVYLK